MKIGIIIGAGTMGHQIGFRCAVHGFGVALYDQGFYAYPDPAYARPGFIDRKAVSPTI